jgi:hypothetical protein
LELQINTIHHAVVNLCACKIELLKGNEASGFAAVTILSVPLKITMITRVDCVFLASQQAKVKRNEKQHHSISHESGMIAVKLNS